MSVLARAWFEVSRIEAKPPLLSFSTTNFNTAPVTRHSLESVVGAVRGRSYEIVCTDNFSTDGSYEALAAFRDEGHPMTLIRRKCNRGQGRQIALESARGEIVVVFDLDTVYNDNWKRLLDWYLERRPPYALIATYSGFYPRQGLQSVGGWRDFQYWEDVDLWIRLATKGLLRTYPMKCGENYKRVPQKKRAKTSRLYARIRDTVAVSSWVPMWVYWKGYGKQFPLTERPLASIYYRGLLLLAYLPGRLRRFRLCRKDFRPEAMLSPDLFLDCGIVPQSELRPLVSKYDTREGVLQAAREGDYVVPGAYD